LADAGYRIKIAETDMENHAVDVPEDLEKLRYSAD